ncbi:ATP-binding cassette domain-containing protein [Lacinutrix sp. WUR7]|uniref:ABC transporter ATP-binding protein n=1 Tax=Lacinutrix sp. WUR7 TaxID=2653681 RepID=UPI00193CA44B|nr:ABC transporter ATP-binding protein [Lacinutrix sp. WUR7]QRM88645.1 ATP-binding cassette domain-containing protein [Lacinutrix sp. WUR7]
MLQVKNITFSYNKTPVLKDISFTVKPGEHLSIIGESGSGKSTLLKVLYGEYDTEKGNIFWQDEEILGPKHNLVIGHDFMKYVAQEFDLMPYISVEENIAKFLSRFYPEEKQKRVAELIEVVELTNVAKTKVKLLSGGQKQRVALARALAKQPEIILLDEPFSHIDNFKKQSLRRSVFKYLKENNIACIVATHDKEDVLGHADKMIVLNNHKIAINDTPENLYKDPKTPLIASFFGEFNVIDGKIIYAHQLQVVEKSNLEVVVKQSYFKGNCYLVEADLEGEVVLFESKMKFKNNEVVYLELLK